MEKVTKQDLLKLSRKEIEAFYSQAEFYGTFDTNIPVKNRNLFCGKITNILSNNVEGDLCPKSIFVPVKFAHNIKPGKCMFFCSVDIKILRSDKHFIKYYIQGIEKEEEREEEGEEERDFMYNMKLQNHYFIGLFTENKDGSFTVRDIRRSDFSELIYKNGKAQQPFVYHPKKRSLLQDGKYYKFMWQFNGHPSEYTYLFKVDEKKQFKEIKPSDLVNIIHCDIMKYPPQ